jgi:hypothetical protein
LKGEKMKFYYENCMGDSGYFSEKDLVKAIYTAWNIEADLYLLNNEIEKLIFAPYEENEFNSDILKEYGYKMEYLGKCREIIDIKTNQVVKYNWSEVKQLV